MMSFFCPNSTQSSLEWDYNANFTHQPNHSATQGSAAKRLFSWDFEFDEDRTFGKVPRMDLARTAKKAVSYQDEFENFQKIMVANIQQFENRSVEIQSPVEQFSSSQNRLLNAVLSLEEMNEELLKVEKIINKSEVKLAEVEKCTNKFQTSIRDLEERCKTVEIANQEKEINLASLKKSLEGKDALFKEAKLRISREVSNLEKCLGLQLVNSTHGGIIFVFTNICRDNNRKKFCFELLLSNRIYKITNCFPKIDNIDEMVKILNRTADLSGFVSQVRRKFVALAQANK